MKKIYLLILMLIVSVVCFSANHTITITPFGPSTNNLSINGGDNVTFVSSGGYIGTYQFSQAAIVFSFTLDWSTPSYTHSFSYWDSGLFIGVSDFGDLATFMIDINVTPNTGGGGGTGGGTGGGGSGGGVGIDNYSINSFKYYFRENILNLKLAKGQVVDHEYSLININGQEIIERTMIQGDLTTIDLSNTPSGIVFLIIYDNGLPVRKEKLVYVKR